MEQVGRLFVICALGVLSFSATGPAAAQSVWKKTDCENSAIHHPELTNCEDGPDPTSQRLGTFEENWAVYGQTADGNKVRLNLLRIVNPAAVIKTLDDEDLENALRRYYRSTFAGAPENARLQDFKTYKALRFRTDGDNQTDCIVFHKWGGLYTANLANSGYTHWIRGYICAPPGKDLAGDAPDRLLADVKVRTIFGSD